ncbi:putative E3 ubiquitin-protein ligase ARI7 [Iris pallida]|uniref:E3 ubiquitin-protein ligase ARI7 n=1 Tax=Iris pallida TaxID=29817 RepID=A0AAX6FNA6_IRIPA|nr:putative E3 ubiquitin-protein ligase ARI7 [Iris pallida]
MDSEDDMHDANDLESPDDDFYSGETGMGSDDGDGDYDFVDNDSDDSEDITSHRQQVIRSGKIPSLIVSSLVSLIFLMERLELAGRRDLLNIISYHFLLKRRVCVFL